VTEDKISTWCDGCGAKRRPLRVFGPRAWERYPVTACEGCCAVVGLSWADGKEVHP
jgi:hypothetical protein